MWKISVFVEKVIKNIKLAVKPCSNLKNDVIILVDNLWIYIQR